MNANCIKLINKRIILWNIFIILVIIRIPRLNIQNSPDLIKITENSDDQTIINENHVEMPTVLPKYKNKVVVSR